MAKPPPNVIAKGDVFPGSIKIRFRCQEDVDEFSEFIGQKITDKQQGYFFPEEDPNSILDLFSDD